MAPTSTSKGREEWKVGKGRKSRGME